MYEERREKFSIKDVVLQLLVILLFVFIMLWLFPLKKDLNKFASTSDLQPLYETIFNQNVDRMKDAAQSYFTTSRLPKNVGDKVKLTLREMLDKKMVLPFLDSNNNQCNLDNSYVEITKMDDEYVLKVNLECTDKSDYLIVYMGCYNYCQTDICEKKEETVKNTNTNINTNTNTNNNNNNNNNPEPTPVTYIYEYKKTVNGYWTDWSNWSTTSVSATDTKQVETTTETIYTEKKAIVAYNVTTTKVALYDDVKVPQYVALKTCLDYGKVYIPTGENKTDSYWELVQSSVRLYVSEAVSTDTKKYVPIAGSVVISDCGNCSSNVTALYNVYQKVTRTIEVRTADYQCTSYGTVYKYISDLTYKVANGKTTDTVTKEPIWGTVKVPTTITKYRYRDFVNGSTDIKWSLYNDTNLLSTGYKYTGNRKQK